MTFGGLRAANVLRCEQAFHPVNDWTPQDWACAVAGETGELCNLIKKLKRHSEGTNTPKDPQSKEEFKVLIAMEMADVVTYLDLLAARLDINLDAAVRAKFNEVSARMGSAIKL